MLGHAGATFRASSVCQARARVRLLAQIGRPARPWSRLAGWRSWALPRC